jgi:hypothetical protein
VRGRLAEYASMPIHQVLRRLDSGPRGLSRPTKSPVSALVSELPKRNGWTIAQHAGDRTPDRMQRLLNRAV